MCNMPKFHRQAGVTLIELIIVIGILGIVAAIGVPMVTGNIRSAKNVDAQNTLLTIYLMQKDYYSKNYCYYTTGGSISDFTATINQFVLGSSATDALKGPIAVGTKNDFYFYITPGTLGSSGSCLGSNSNDYTAWARSRTSGTIIYSINQGNIKTGF